MVEHRNAKRITENGIQPHNRLCRIKTRIYLHIELIGLKFNLISYYAIHCHVDDSNVFFLFISSL